MELEVLDTYEKRAAYIERCWAQIRKQEAESKLRQMEFDLLLQTWQMQYQVLVWTGLAPLIYRGMFDPTFCSPAKSAGDE